MNTEVFLLCLNCRKITLGIGSGETHRDSIVCKECSKLYISSCVDKDMKGFTHQDKALFIPENLQIG